MAQSYVADYDRRDLEISKLFYVPTEYLALSKLSYEKLPLETFRRCYHFEDNFDFLKFIHADTVPML